MSNHSTDLPGKVHGTMQQGKNEALTGLIRKHYADFVEFYSQNIDRVYRYILVNVGDSEIAQDLASETFLAAMKQRHSFRGEGTLLAWVLGIARHKVLDHFRARRDVVNLDSVEHVISTESLPEELAEHQWQLEQVKKALHILTPDRAHALTLYVFAELEPEEIGLILGKSHAAVKMLVYRAVQDLKNYLTTEKRG